MVSQLRPMAQQFVDNINRIAGNMSEAQTQLSTGLRVNVVSDSPDVVSTLLHKQKAMD